MYRYNTIGFEVHFTSLQGHIFGRITMILKSFVDGDRLVFSLVGSSTVEYVLNLGLFWAVLWVFKIIVVVIR